MLPRSPKRTATWRLFLTQFPVITQLPGTTPPRPRTRLRRKRRKAVQRINGKAVKEVRIILSRAITRLDWCRVQFAQRASFATAQENSDGGDEPGEEVSRTATIESPLVSWGVLSKLATAQASRNRTDFASIEPDERGETSSNFRSLPIFARLTPRMHYPS